MFWPCSLYRNVQCFCSLCHSFFFSCLSLSSVSLCLCQFLCSLSAVVSVSCCLTLCSLSVCCLSTTFHFLMMCFNMDLSSWRLVLELFLREDVPHCGASLLRTSLGFDLRLDRLVLDSVFHSSTGPPVNFRLRTDLDVRFDSLGFFFSAWARF